MAQKKVPHTFVIVFFIIVIAAVMTWMVKPGYYIKENVIENGVEVTSMNFYYQDQLPEQYCNDYQSEPQTWQIFSALFKGFEKQSSIIVFILIIGGAFWIMNKSHAIDMGIFSFLRFTRRLENIKLF
ncbi:MAG: YfcC family protein, partial [Bacteroidales bacterium]|nr:YfcC family protein [Bacteroidales bacterium]